MSGHPAEIQPILDQALDGDSLYQLRATVAAHAVQAGLPPRRADDLVMAAHELAANVVRHGSGRGRLRLWRHEQTLHCQVTDDGAKDLGSGDGPESGAGGGPDRAAQPWRIEPGHGLWLVRQLADRTSLHPGFSGPAVTISFTLGPPGALQPFTLARHDSRASTVLAVAGQLDLNSAGELTDAVERLLARDPAAQLVIDLAGLTFWDAFGLAGLLRAQGRIDASAGASLILASLPAQLDAHLRETGLTGRFTLAGGIGAAADTEACSPVTRSGEAASADGPCSP